MRASLTLFACTICTLAPSASAAQVEGAHARNASARSTTALDHVLIRSGSNRTELEAALEHFDPQREAEEAAAMEWLVAGLDRHGYAQRTWFDAGGQAVEISRDAFASAEGFEFAWARLVEEHGELQAGIARFEGDSLSLTAEELAQNVRWAFTAWRERPWAHELTWQQFLEGVLPHRVGDEPLENWRKVLYDTFDDLPDQLKDSSDADEAANWIRRSVRSWVEHAPQYAWHLSDQSMTQMLSSGFGRAEDLAHLELMALRANAIPAALDYLPAWGARSGSHAWTRLLNRESIHATPFANRVAKVYRRTYRAASQVLDEIAWREEPLPAWFADERMRDVTAEYTNVANAVVPLHAEFGARMSAAVFACVWSDAQWVPVALGQCTDESSFAEFDQLGVGVVYLPAWHDEAGLHPAGSPFAIEADGRVHLFDGLGVESPGEMRWLDQWTPAAPADFGWAARDAERLEAQEDYRVLVWEDDGWCALRRLAAGTGPDWGAIPLRRLCRLQRVGAPDQPTRPFTVNYSGLVWW